MSLVVISQIVIGVLGLISLWLKDYYSQGGKDKRSGKKTQEGRNELLDGDVSAVESRVDRVCSQSSSNAGSKSDEDIARQLSTLYGVVVDGLSDSKNTGTSGKVPD